MSKHMIWMLIGCVLPLILIMILPSFGVSSNVSFFIFVILMFACHLMMLKGHKHGDHDGKAHHHEK